VDVKSTHMEESVTSDNKEQKIKKDWDFVSAFWYHNSYNTWWFGSDKFC
jgi:hypothetical protein